jgi:hypothetical protein
MAGSIRPGDSIIPIELLAFHPTWARSVSPVDRVGKPPALTGDVTPPF